MARTGIKYGPSEICLLVPEHPGINTKKVVANFCEDFMETHKRSQTPNVYDVFAASVEGVN